VLLGQRQRRAEKDHVEAGTRQTHRQTEIVPLLTIDILVNWSLGIPPFVPLVKLPSEPRFGAAGRPADSTCAGDRETSLCSFAPVDPSGFSVFRVVRG